MRAPFAIDHPPDPAAAPALARPAALLGLALLVLLGHAWLVARLAPGAPRPVGVNGVTGPTVAPTLTVRQLPAPALLPLVAAALPAPAALPTGQARAAPPTGAEGQAAGEMLAAPPPASTSAALAGAEAEPAADAAGGLPPPVYPVQLPDPVQLRYALSVNGQPGEALLTWRHDGQRYDLQLAGLASMQARPLLAQASQGRLDALGLAPDRFVDRRRSGRQMAANFQRDLGRIGFSGPTVHYPAWPGAQDRLSWLAQLAAILSASPDEREVSLFVVDARGLGGLWRLQRQDDVALPAPGTAAGLQRWQREPPRPEGLRVQAWLDPSQGHWPVQLRFSVPRSGHLVELRLLAPPSPPP